LFISNRNSQKPKRLLLPLSVLSAKPKVYSLDAEEAAFTLKLLNEMDGR